MLRYVYRCRTCERETEVKQRITDEPLRECEECGGELRRVPQVPGGIIYRALGFYTTDSRILH